MGDFNSQIGIGKPEENPTVGKYGYGKRNVRGWKLLRFCQEHELNISNSHFKKCKGRLWTWIAPNQTFESQIDFILTKNFCKLVNNCSVSNFNFHLDHRLLMCEIQINNQKRFYNKTTTTNRITKDNAGAYQNELDKLLTNNRTIDITTAILKATKLMKVVNPPTFDTAITDEINNLRSQREKLKRIKTKTKENKIELNVTCRLIKKKFKEHNYNKNKKLIEDTNKYRQY